MLNINESGRVSLTINSSKLASDINIKQEQVDRYIKTCLHRSCEVIRDYAKSHHGFKNHTGRLERAIRYKVISDVKNPYGVVYIDPKIAVNKKDDEAYGKFVTHGTGLFNPENRHWIYPRKKKCLSWLDRSTMKYTHYSKVKGSPADKFLENARTNTELEVKYIWEEALKELIDGK